MLQGQQNMKIAEQDVWPAVTLQKASFRRHQDLPCQFRHSHKMAPAKTQDNTAKKGKGRPKGSVKKPKTSDKAKAAKVKAVAKKDKEEKTKEAE